MFLRGPCRHCVGETTTKPPLPALRIGVGLLHDPGAADGDAEGGI